MWLLQNSGPCWTNRIQFHAHPRAHYLGDEHLAKDKKRELSLHTGMATMVSV